ncbi:hypothetical protein C1638_021440 [Chryseobacterium oncorhynchi]|uniref:Bacterial mobilisation domain-containing protein n=2 Tax=Chryseobacterium oncorhynchi TaxID=741074 RepID=A0A316WEQ6_9FLAO|nr:hypothetical protein C1638_021440 [Chryseobacterium oncorhynchi]
MNNMLVPVAYFVLLIFKHFMKNKGGRPKIIEEKLLRNKRIDCRLTEEEYNQLLKKIPIGVTISDGVRTLLLSNKSNTFHAIDFNKYLFEVNKIGTNINQISKNINTYGSIDEAGIYNLKNQIKAINTHFELIISSINNKL